ncbi:ABC transporter permease [uncultured Nocardioides sp.]|uniref:ABC transporter permease n=1 Tax=uncultured Nocardioides sp. TaxID=198441 RepID=UPI002601D05E|nr:ABC transporter permease [uncultured Nocardioides sp.]
MTDTLGPPPAAQAEATADDVDTYEGTGGGPRPTQAQRIVTPRDAVLPIVLVLTLVALYTWVQGQTLDNISVNILDTGAIISATVEHIYIAFTIAVLVVLIAVPMGVLVTRDRTKFLAPIVLGIANFGQAAPSLGLLALVGIYYTGFWAVVLILTGYALLSVLRNTIAGLQQVDKGVLDAAKGMGMSPVAVLLRVELPLAVPIIGAGARTALILAVATVPLGAFLNAGGLGQQLIASIKTDRAAATLAIAVIIAVLALFLDWLASILQRAATPRGVR